MAQRPHSTLQGCGQGQFIDRPLPEGGSGLAATCAWVIERIDRPLTVDELAHDAACTSWDLRPAFSRRDRHDSDALDHSAAVTRSKAADLRGTCKGTEA